MSANTMVRSPAISFIVRVWNEEGNDSRMRGQVEYVGTGEKRFFLDYSSLIELLESWRQDLELVG